MVSTGETLARCFERKRFVEFQTFLRTLLGSLWCQNIRRVHLILDNGSPQAPKQLSVWLSDAAAAVCRRAPLAPRARVVAGSS